MTPVGPACSSVPVRLTTLAVPMWFPVDGVPFHEMWEDDQHWLPHVLAGGSFQGWFEFDGEKMLSKRVELLP